MLDKAANWSIILLSLLIGFIQVQQWRNQQSSSAPSRKQLKAGDRLEVPGLVHDSSRQVLAIFLSTRCRFCDESLPLYHQLTGDPQVVAKHRIVAIFNQNSSDVRDYLKQHGLQFEQSLTPTAPVSGVQGTPTMVLFDRQGLIKQVWTGKLTSESAQALLLRLASESAK